MFFKRVISSLLSFTLLISLLATTVCAADSPEVNKPTKMIKADTTYIIDSVEQPVESATSESPSLYFAQSANGVEKSGSYRSKKMETGMPGFTYDIYFEWTLVEKDGDYIISDLENMAVTCYRNPLLTLAWGSVSRTTTRLDYVIAKDCRSVTFYTDYEFDCTERDTGKHIIIPTENVKTVTVDDLIK